MLGDTCPKTGGVNNGIKLITLVSNEAHSVQRLPKCHMFNGFISQMP